MNAITNNTDKSLPKSEILRGKKIIQELFDKGSSFYLYPFRVKYLGEAPQHDKTRILVTVPKKLYKRAVDRNQLKRRIKEAYRLHKNILLDHTAKNPDCLCFIYTAKEKISFDIIEKKLILVLQRLVTENKGNS